MMGVGLHFILWRLEFQKKILIDTISCVRRIKWQGMNMFPNRTSQIHCGKSFFTSLDSVHTDRVLFIELWLVKQTAK